MRIFTQVKPPEDPEITVGTIVRNTNSGCVYKVTAIDQHNEHFSGVILHWSSSPSSVGTEYTNLKIKGAVPFKGTIIITVQ